MIPENGSQLRLLSVKVTCHRIWMTMDHVVNSFCKIFVKNLRQPCLHFAQTFCSNVPMVGETKVKWNERMGSATKIFFATRILNFLHFLFILHSQSFQDVLTFLRNWVSTITLRKRQNIVRKGHSRRAFGSFNKDIYFALTQHHLRRRSSDKKNQTKTFIWNKCAIVCR